MNTISAALSTVLFQPVLKVFAYVAYMCFTIAGWFLGMCGTLFNISIQLTTHLGIFINNTPVIYQVWGTMRDIASMLLIFFILWASILVILGLAKPQLKSMLTQIIIAGVLINFSFFFARVMIDASNILSLEFYNAMTPEATSIYQPNDTLGTIIKKSASDGSGGLSGIFARSLGVTQWWTNTASLKPQDNSNESQLIAMIIGNYAGTVVQIMAGLSFLGAAIAALWRTVALIMLLGFSSIWIAAYAVPKLSSLRSQWTSQFYSNLMFLPIYLALMYVAVLIMSKSDLNSAVLARLTSGGDATGAYMQLFLVFAIVMFLVNLPLFTAIKMSNLSMKNLGWIDKLGSYSSSVRDWATKGRISSLNQNIISRGASAISRSETLKNVASRSLVAGSIYKGIRATSKSYEDKLDEQVEKRTKFAESLGYDRKQMNNQQRALRSFQQQLIAAQARNAPPSVISQLKSQIGATRANITRIEGARKKAYADARNKGSFDTLYTYVARKNKVAAAKVQIPVLEKQMTQYKDSLKDTRSDIKQLMSAIRNNPVGMPGGVSIPVAAGAPALMATPAQAAELSSLKNDEARDLGLLNTLENQIDSLKRIS